MQSMLERFSLYLWYLLKALFLQDQIRVLSKMEVTITLRVNCK